jgi:hypothetical protein
MVVDCCGGCQVGLGLTRLWLEERERDLEVARRCLKYFFNSEKIKLARKEVETREERLRLE